MDSGHRLAMGEPNFFFDGWAPILRILLVGTVTYFTLMLLVRISGPRTLAQTSVFDFILAVAIGPPSAVS